MTALFDIESLNLSTVLFSAGRINVLCVERPTMSVLRGDGTYYETTD